MKLYYPFYRLICLIYLSLSLIYCSESIEDDAIPEVISEPLPESFISFNYNGNKFEAALDSAFVNPSSFSNETVNFTVSNTDVTISFLLQQPVGESFEEKSYVFRNATSCLNRNGFCANFVLIEPNDTATVAYASRYSSDPFNINFEVANSQLGGRIKGTFSGTISTNNKSDNISIEDGKFDIYLERE